MDNKCRIGIDVGGTFTDIVAVSDTGTVTFAKAASTPNDPSIGVMNAVERLADELGINSETLLSKRRVLFTVQLLLPTPFLNVKVLKLDC